MPGRGRNVCVVPAVVLVNSCMVDRICMRASVGLVARTPTHRRRTPSPSFGVMEGIARRTSPAADCANRSRSQFHDAVIRSISSRDTARRSCTVWGWRSGKGLPGCMRPSPRAEGSRLVRGSDRLSGRVAADRVQRGSVWCLHPMCAFVFDVSAWPTWVRRRSVRVRREYDRPSWVGQSVGAARVLWVGKA